MLRRQIEIPFRTFAPAANWKTIITTWTSNSTRIGTDGQFCFKKFFKKASTVFQMYQSWSLKWPFSGCTFSTRSDQRIDGVSWFRRRPVLTFAGPFSQSLIRNIPCLRFGARFRCVQPHKKHPTRKCILMLLVNSSAVQLPPPPTFTRQSTGP